jgi:hypothetical protein
MEPHLKHDAERNLPKLNYRIHRIATLRLSRNAPEGRGRRFSNVPGPEALHDPFLGWFI